MEPRPLFIIAVLFMLFNGGVLGFMHKSLSRDVQASAMDWRIATLLFAAAWVLLGVQDLLPARIVLPLGNVCLYAGAALYWRSTRRFFGLEGHVLMWLPVVLGVVGTYYFSAPLPSHAGRSVVSALVLSGYCFSAAHVGFTSGKSRGERSSRVLTALFMLVGVCVYLRGVFSLFFPDAVPGLLESGIWLVMGTSLTVAMLPVIGTTTFLVMCSERVSRQWEQAAATDYLTGLPNRRTITATGEGRFNSARRRNDCFALAMIDIDHFKSINDRFGHEAGDLALKHVAVVLEQHCRGPNMLGRQGGEEFVALLEVANAGEARAAGERLRRALEAQPFVLHGESLPLTVSVGVAVITAADSRFDDLLNRADAALYAAKSNGRNRVEM